MEKIAVGVIIINYNNAALTIDCLYSLIEKTHPELIYKIVVVDNASKLADYQKLRKALDESPFKEVLLVSSEINTGFGGGNMLGVKEVNADYYAFVNNDTILVNDCLSELYQFMDENPAVAACGPALFDEAMNPQVGFNHFVSLKTEILGSALLERLNPGKYPPRRKLYSQPMPVDFINGSFMFFRAEDFDRLGGFDPNIFLFYEEHDICLRLRKQGKETWFVPQGQYIHYQGKSMPQRIDSKLELKLSLFYVMRKHDGKLEYQLLKLFYLLRYGFSALVKPGYKDLLRKVWQDMPMKYSLRHKQKPRVINP
jgi:GT2 family glycosyltransferase